MVNFHCTAPWIHQRAGAFGRKLIKPFLLAFKNAQNSKTKYLQQTGNKVDRELEIELEWPGSTNADNLITEPLIYWAV